MKIGKYPVKHSYKIARLVSDVFSLGLAVFICSVEYMFLTVYEDTLTQYIGADRLQLLTQNDSSIGWRHYLTLAYPAAVLAVFAVYAVLVLTSHKFSSLNITKRNAQKVRDMYALCVSLCKIPALMLLNEMMIITHNKLLMSEESWFSVQLVLDLAVIAMLIVFFRRLMIRITEPEQAAQNDTIKVKAAVKPQKPEQTADNESNDTERS